MPFLTEPAPPRREPLPVLPGVRRLVADNPSVMTYHGTNTFLIETGGGTVVLDPGPDDPAHVEAVLRAAGPVALILLSHQHSDHDGALPALRDRTGARVAAWHAPRRGAPAPDIALRDGEEVAGMTALHTPGHASDHVCFAWDAPDGTRILFSADHVMSWSSSIVAPPDGDMAAYYASLRRLLPRDDDLFLPGHGPPLPNPRDLVSELLAHRIAREQAILAVLGEANAPLSPRAIADRLYSQVNPMLRMAAEMNVLAHLLKLEAEGHARRVDDDWISVRPKP